MMTVDGIYKRPRRTPNKRSKEVRRTTESLKEDTRSRPKGEGDPESTQVGYSETVLYLHTLLSRVR